MKVCRRSRLLIAAFCSAALPLAGCGGGGTRPGPIAPPEAGTPTPPPAPAPAPAPAPTPTPPPINYNDAEYQRSNAASAANAITAYQNGATGRGVKLAVVDSGINASLPEFAGRIDAASQNLHNPGAVTPTDFHGTAVASVAAAARNGSGTLGVAFDSTIIALNSANPGDCDGDDGCTHEDSDIARGIDIARTNGARVINISLGGEGVSPVLAQALNRATQAGIVVVFSAGNEGASDPNELALTAVQQGGNGVVIIAGALTTQGNMASYSSRAGSAASFYLTTFADGVRTIDDTGQGIIAFGTSFASPVISGAAALLADAFPNLSGGQIVELLLRSADDLGAPGTDATYGRGRLNITRAFQPQGTLSLAGSGAPVAVGDGGQASGAMGDAVSGKALGAIILDGYSRAFAIDLAARLTGAARQQPLAQVLHGDTRTGSRAAGPVSVALTVSRNLRGEPLVGLAQTGLGYEDARRARALAGYAVGRLTTRTAVAFGFSESGRALQRQLAGRPGNAFLVARDPMSRHGFIADAGNGLAVRHMLGPVGITASSEVGKIWNPDERLRPDHAEYSLGGFGLDGSIGPVFLSIGASRLRETETVLGGRLGSALASGGATSWFVDGGAALTLGNRWDAEAGFRRGWTEMPAGSAAEAGRLASEAWFLDLGRSSALQAGDRLALRVTQPLRVASGGVDLTLPVSYDYADGSVGYAARFFNLTPTGREIDFEAAYGIGLGGGALDLNAYLRREPDHIASAPDDLGAAVRFRRGF